MGVNEAVDGKSRYSASIYPTEMFKKKSKASDWLVYLGRGAHARQAYSDNFYEIIALYKQILKALIMAHLKCYLLYLICCWNPVDLPAVRLKTETGSVASWAQLYLTALFLTLRSCV